MLQQCDSAALPDNMLPAEEEQQPPAQDDRQVAVRDCKGLLNPQFLAAQLEREQAAGLPATVNTLMPTALDVTFTRPYASNAS